jgi:hypothetical protein
MAGVGGMEGLVPLRILTIVRYGDWLRDFGRDEELLLFKILCTFVQLWGYRSGLPVLRWGWYPMKQSKTGDRNH